MGYRMAVLSRVGVGCVGNAAVLVRRDLIPPDVKACQEVVANAL